VGDAEILRMDMSRQTKKANAFVAGIGSTHRIVLGDTLIDTFEPDEITFVVAHELGHYVSRDTWRMIALAESVTAALLGAVAGGLRSDASGESVRVLRIAAWLGLGMLAVRPAMNAFSRSREWAADRFATATTRDPQSGVAAFRRLRDQNLAEEQPPAWYEWIFASHPSLGKRIAALDVK
jgi:STE24 endopeptidase